MNKRWNVFDEFGNKIGSVMPQGEIPGIVYILGLIILGGIGFIFFLIYKILRIAIESIIKGEVVKGLLILSLFFLPVIILVASLFADAAYETSRNIKQAQYLQIETTRLNQESEKFAISDILVGDCLSNPSIPDCEHSSGDSKRVYFSIVNNSTIWLYFDAHVKQGFGSCHTNEYTGSSIPPMGKVNYGCLLGNDKAYELLDPNELCVDASLDYSKIDPTLPSSTWPEEKRLCREFSVP